MRHPTGTNFSRRDYKKMAEIQDGSDANKAQAGTATLAHSDPSIAADEPPFRMPPLTAIAGVLIQHWAERKILDNSNMSSRNGNL